MPGAPMPAIEEGGVGAVEVAHGAGKVCFRRLDEQVKAVSRLHVGVHAKAKAPDRALQDLQEALPLAVISVDRLALVAAHRDVVQGTRKHDPQGTDHDETT
jgi:hypothetical protein